MGGTSNGKWRKMGKVGSGQKWLRPPRKKRFDRSTASRNRDFEDVSCIFYDLLHCTYLRFFSAHPKRWIIQISISEIDFRGEFASRTATYFMVLEAFRYIGCVSNMHHLTHGIESRSNSNNPNIHSSRCFNCFGLHRY